MKWSFLEPMPLPLSWFLRLLQTLSQGSNGFVHLLQRETGGEYVHDLEDASGPVSEIRGFGGLGNEYGGGHESETCDHDALGNAMCARDRQECQSPLVLKSEWDFQQGYPNQLPVPQ